MTPALDEHRYAPGRLFLAALVFIVAAPLFWRQVELRPAAIARAHENAVLYQHVYPAYHYGFGRLRSGDLPLWNPNQACGTPFQADPAVSLFQPVNAVFLVLPTEQALAAHAYIALSLMGLFFVLFARALGLGLLPSILGGVVYAFCGASAAAMSRPALANAMAWTPLVFWAQREYARRWNWSMAVVGGWAIAMLLLSGSPVLVIAILCVLGPYGAYLTLFPGKGGTPGLGRRVAGMAVMGAVALGVSAVQWAPTLEWLLTLEDPWAALFRLDLAGRPAQDLRAALAQLLTPESGALPPLGYVGVVGLLAVPGALWHRDARRHSLFFAVATGACLMLSVCGAAFPPFPFRAFAVPAALGWAVLAAIGADRLLMPRHTAGALALWPPALMALLLAAGLLYAGGGEARGRVLIAVLLWLPFFLVRTRGIAVTSGVLLVLLLFLDVALAGANRYHHPFQDAPACYRTHDDAIRAAQEQALGGRLLVSANAIDPALPANLGLLAPVAVANGPHLPLTRAQARWWERIAEAEASPEATACAERLLDLMGVRAVLSRPGGPYGWIDTSGDPPRFRPVLTSDAATLVANSRALPRAYFVPRWHRAATLDAAMGALCADSFDPSETCVVLGAAPDLEALATQAPPISADPTEVPECLVLSRDPERVVVRLDTPQPGITVLSDTFAPGWHATLDGAPTALLQVNALFRGVPTPAGRHEIAFTYRPAGFTAGALISLATLAVLALAALSALTPKRPPRAQRKKKADHDRKSADADSR